METFDLTVIGAGTGGLVTAVGASQFGAKVALIEKDKLGGECLYTGCVPSKTLIRSAKVASLVRRAGEFGIKIPSYEIDFPGVMARMRRVIEKVGEHDSPERFKKLGVAVIKGEASFHSSDTLRVNGDNIKSRRFVVATGSRSIAPPVEGLEAAGYLTHVEALNLERQPKSLVILGAGPIGLEFAQMFSRLGTKVTVLEVLGQILPREDAEVAQMLEEQLKVEGIEIYTCTRTFRVEVKDGCKIIHGSCESESPARRPASFAAEEILVAAGRAPNVEGLGLEKVGVTTEKKGIVVDAYMQSTAKNVWACGDVTGKYLFTHVAEYQARLLVGNVLFPFRRKADYRVVPWTTFTDPEVSHVGFTEAEARERYGNRISVFRHSFGDVDRAVAEGEPLGFVKVVCDTKGQILGAHILGPQAGDLLQPLVFAMKQRMPIGRISQTIHAYPTLVEANRRAADQYYREKLFYGWMGKFLRGWVRWLS
ncbi:MAG: mercuric reductase [Deltaproteobacteria bacterium]|nr:mercuric reductase [Deltaproteobacteria bacterium]